VHYGKGRAADIFSVEGVGGVYLANQVHAGDVGRGLLDGVHTRISWDAGGSWVPLVPPASDSTGEAYPCQLDSGAKNCDLHLFFKSNKGGYASLHTDENAIGLIMGTGRVGAFLTETTHAEGSTGMTSETMFLGEADVGTFLSRDAGRSWVEVKKGGWLYAFGDHGSVIVMVPDQRPTTEILYSVDEGLSWEGIPVESMVATAITGPSDGVSLRFIVFGKTALTKSKGVLINLDFKALNLRKCKPMGSSGSRPSDYENWNLRPPKSEVQLTPGVHAAEECLLGRAIVYMRKKQHSRCFNGLKHEKRISQEPCKCVAADFECDYGYHLKDASKTISRGGECVWHAGALSDAEQERLQDLKNLDAMPALKQELCNRYLNDTDVTHELTSVTGYRKIPGDFCTGGLKKGGTTYSCAAPLINLGNHGYMFWGFFLTLACSGGALAWNKFNGSSGPSSYGYRKAVSSYDQADWEREGLFSSALGESEYTEEF